MKSNPRSVQQVIKSIGEDERYLYLFVIAGGLIVLLDIVSGFQGMHWLGTDIWHHRAVLLALGDNPSNPLNPHIMGSEGSRTYTPIFVILGYLASLLDLSPDTTLGISAIINIFLLYFGAKLFTRALGTRNVIFFLFIILYAWLRAPNYTGFNNIRTIVQTSSFPSLHSFALTLIIWGIFIETIQMQGSQLLRWSAMAALLWLNILTHQFTAFICMGALPVFTLIPLQGHLKANIKILILITLAMVLSFLWPYFDLIKIFKSASNSQWGHNNWFYDPLTILSISLPALMGLVFLRSMFKIRTICIMGICTVGVFSVYIVTYFFGITAGHRLLPFWIFFLQVIIYLAFVTNGPQFSETYKINAIRPYFLFSLTVLALFQCTWSIVDVYRSNLENSLGISIGYYKIGDYYGAAKSLSSDIDKTSVVIAKGNVAYPIQGFGIRVVSIPRMAPMISDLQERQESSVKFFSAGLTCDERLNIAKKFNATHAAFIYGELNEDIQISGGLKTYNNLISVIKLSTDCPISGVLE